MWGSRSRRRRVPHGAPPSPGPTGHALNTGCVLWYPGVADLMTSTEWEPAIGSVPIVWQTAPDAPIYEADADPDFGYFTFEDRADRGSASSSPSLTGDEATLSVTLRVEFPAGADEDQAFPAKFGPTDDPHYLLLGQCYMGELAPSRPNFNAGSQDRSLWHTVTFIADGTDWKCYQGTTLIHTLSAIGAAGKNSALTFGRAAVGTSYGFAGGLKDVRLWDRAISTGELADWIADVAANYPLTYLV